MADRAEKQPAHSHQAPLRPGKLGEHTQWLAEHFRQHRGNCDVLRQALHRELGIMDACRRAPAARGVRAERSHRALPDPTYGHQLQIDFGTVRVPVIERKHLVGVVGAHLAGVNWLQRAAPPPVPAELLRPIQEYERMLGGAW